MEIKIKQLKLDNSIFSSEEKTLMIIMQLAVTGTVMHKG